MKARQAQEAQGKARSEARERAELEALEKGLDPTLVLDDSVVEVAQGSTVAQFAELLEVSPNDIIKRLFMLGQALTLTQTMSDDLSSLSPMTGAQSARRFS